MNKFAAEFAEIEANAPRFTGNRAIFIAKAEKYWISALTRSKVYAPCFDDPIEVALEILGTMNETLLNFTSISGQDLERMVRKLTVAKFALEHPSPEYLERNPRNETKEPNEDT